MTDKKILNISSASVFAVLLLALIIPHGGSGRIVAAILLLPAAIIIPFLIKKRNILSINKNQVLMIISVTALVYVMIYYLTGLEFGFFKNPYRLTSNNFFTFTLPIAAIIVLTEVIRHVVMSQNNKASGVLCYLSLVMADMLICSTIPAVTSFNKFMDLVAGALFPALIANLLYNYLTVRYGPYPNLVFRLLTVLHAYIIPVTSGISDSLWNLFNILLPIGIYLFIDFLYGKRKRYALENTSRFWRIASKILSVIVVIILIGTVMLVSNQFYYGAFVIASDSMTGELNKGDVAIYESYEGQPIVEGQVIVFEKNGSMIVHRVVDIKIINGITRYWTKGDVNTDNDSGYLTDADIVGTVSYKLPVLGYPTIWMRSLFNR